MYVVLHNEDTNYQLFNSNLKFGKIFFYGL